LPSSINLQAVGDQSRLVKSAIYGVLPEGLLAAAALVGLMILLFLGSWRSTMIIIISIPLSILFSLAALSWLGETINIMTLGGFALAVGMLVDDGLGRFRRLPAYLGARRRNRHARKHFLYPLHLKSWQEGVSNAA
jgi:multidrug efflux pump subunit AcrB